MNEITERERNFLDVFSNSDIVAYELPDKIDLPLFDKFLTNEIGISYIGNMIKDIDIRLYLEYLKMLKDKINFIDNYNVENSKLSKINTRGIHVDENLYLELSDTIGIVNGKNVMHYVKGIDGLRIKLVDKSFEEMINTNVSSSVLPEEVISIINDSNYIDASIDSPLIESKDYNYYRFKNEDKNLVLEKKLFIKK